MTAAPPTITIGAVVFFAPTEIHPIAWPIQRRQQPCRRGEWIRLGIINHTGDNHDDQDQVSPDRTHSSTQR